MHKDFEYALRKHSAQPKIHELFSSSELSELEGKLPERMIEIMRAFGRFTFNNGWTHCCHPNDLQPLMDLILGNDADLRPENCTAYAYTAFGVVSAFHSEYGIAKFNLVHGTVTCRGLTKEPGKFIENPIFSPFSRPEEEFSPDGKPLFGATLEEHGELEWGQIYGLVPAYTLGGIMRPANFNIMDAFVHMNILAELQAIKLVDIQIGASWPTVIREIG